ncbi:hypothetical protein [Ensifer sp. Root127]|uniref:hypothetical protein n=1 Tax=Ensifer sp. Root127 TaxID=1736440 RepID=UPI00070FDA61|nr:hypothetical protein [Ensifer sp. Root127]KQW82038.1 hypothetical protein ASD03_23250 [Ensifer sp. Root127]
MCAAFVTKFSLVAAVSLGTLAVQARAECNPRTFMVKEVQDIQQSGETELAFVLTSSEEKFNSAKKNASASGAYGIISGSANYGEAQEKARKIAQATKFDYKNSYASSYFSQTLSAKALAAYRECLVLDKEKPGLRLWLNSREGDFFFFNSFWVGTDTKQGIAQYDAEPFVIGGTVVGKPDAWIKGTTEEVVIQRNGNNDILLRMNVGGLVKTQVIVKDPPAVTWDTKPAASLRLIKTASHGPNPGCSAGEITDCIHPTRPGGYFVVGSAAMTERSSSDPSRYSEKFYLDTPDQVCVKMTQSTGACEVTQSAQGRLTVLEKFPLSAQ